MRAIPGEGLNVRATACSSGAAVGTDTQPATPRHGATTMTSRSTLASPVEPRDVPRGSLAQPGGGESKGGPDGGAPPTGPRWPAGDSAPAATGVNDPPPR